MAQINMSGQKSLSNDISKHVQAGGNASHILHVKIANGGTPGPGPRIREMIFSKINGRRTVKNVMVSMSPSNGAPVRGNPLLIIIVMLMECSVTAQ
jgi:hypothetical protein